MKDESLLRYSRQIMLPEIGIDGQERLLNSRVLIMGLGGLGCPVAIYLAASGVGHLVLADFDIVDLSNLQRQIIHTNERIGLTKVESARAAIEALNPEIKVSCISDRMNSDMLSNEVMLADIVVDCTDSFATRFDINQACVAAQTPLVSGAAIRLEGQVLVYDPNQDSCPCYRCLHEHTGEGTLNCAENGVVSVTVGVIGTIQATETIKLIVGFGRSLAGYLLIFDAKYMEWKKLRLRKNPKCTCCGVIRPEI